MLRQSCGPGEWSPYCESQYAQLYIPVGPGSPCRSALLRLEGHGNGWVVALGMFGLPRDGCSGLTPTPKLSTCPYCSLRSSLACCHVTPMPPCCVEALEISSSWNSHTHIALLHPALLRDKLGHCRLSSVSGIRHHRNGSEALVQGDCSTSAARAERVACAACAPYAALSCRPHFWLASWAHPADDSLQPTLPVYLKREGKPWVQVHLHAVLISRRLTER